MQIFYLLSIILINPFGGTRGEIWTQPKVAVLAVICGCNLQLLYEHRKEVKLSRKWWIVAIAFLIFLGDCLISSLMSEAGFMRSLIGHSIHRSGLVYWGLIAVFTLTNSLVLQIKPELLKQQLQGFIAGGVILALSVIPQSFDWTIDYTATTGHLFNNNILQSSIYRNHQPIGLYSHRGHTAFVLAAVAAAILAGCKRGFRIISNKYLLFLVPVVAALFLTQTRAGILALCGALFFLVRHEKAAWISAIICLCLIVRISLTRNIAGVSVMQQLTFDRIWIWNLSKTAIGERPYFGYGLDGFTIAHPYIQDTNEELIISPYTKSHNLLLDWVVSIGIPGAFLYLLILIYCLVGVIKSEYSPLAGIAIAYLIYTFTWFDSGQFTHIAWWSLSLFNEKVANIFNLAFIPKRRFSVESATRDRVSTAVKRILRKVRTW